MGGVYVVVQNVQSLCSVQTLRSVQIVGIYGNELNGLNDCRRMTLILLKTLRSSFESLRTNGVGVEISEDFPFY